MNAQKKKNSRERRVLTGALVIAGVMIAGSTFAWFTSQDEVTNRLSANADYNVSIVESFTPPENWTPGMEINKDVYAVNTGNIAAYVKETVSGVMSVTKEIPTNDFNADTCVKLTEAERYVMEAGSYLAFAPDGSSAVVGNQVVAVTPDPSDLDAYAEGATDFTPDANGLYVFRRSIEVDGNNKTEKFSYEGYYYNGGNYYKISNLVVTPDTTPDFASDGIETDGNLSAATSGYYTEQTTKETAKLTYDAVNNRLVATIANSNSNTVTYEQLTAAATAYDAALEEYQRALAAYAAALKESNTQNGTAASLKAALDAAQIALNDAIDALQVATDAKASADARVTDLTAQHETLTAQLATADAAVTAKTDAKNAADADVAGAQADVAAQFAADVQTKLGKTVGDATYSDLNGLYGTDYANYNYYQLVVAQKKAQEEYDAAVADRNAITTQQTAVDVDLADATAEAAAADANVMDAQSAKDTTQIAFNDAKAAYDAAVGEGGTGATDAALNAATTALSTAAQNLANAEADYKSKDAALNSASDIKINIKLSDAVTTAGGVADKWQHLPVASTSDNAVFYYTSILDGSETSAKLIDSVELDPSVTKEMYKAFDFDLNVVLESAQIAYDTDNETILTTPAVEELNATPALTNNKDIDTAIKWSNS